MKTPTRTFPWRKALPILLGSVLFLVGVTAISFFAYLMFCIAHSLRETERIETDVQKYTERLAFWRKYNGPELVEHFPEAIPDGATNVAFSMFPGFLQGGAWMYLRVGVPASEALKIQQKAEERAPRSGGAGMNLPADPALAFEPLPRIEFCIPEAKSMKHLKWEALPPDYRFFVFEAKPGGTKEEINYQTWEKKTVGDWNHGTTSGIAVSLERNEVVYWMESW